jgi:hypothetical protein
MERGDGIDEQAVGEAMDMLSSELAARFGALSDTFGEWRKPETARAVLESVLAGDREGFHKLLPGGFDGPEPDPLDPPDNRIPKGPRFCTMVAEVVEKIIPARRVPCSRVRTDLSPAEKARYLAIVYSCFRDGCLPPLEPVTFTEGKCTGIVVPPGEFLTRLTNAGLVESCTCLVDGGITAQLTPPEQMCT